MAKFSSASTWFLVDGYNLIAAKLKSLSYKAESKMEDTTSLGDLWQGFTPVGLGAVTLTQGGGYFDTDTNLSHTALSGSVPTTPQATARVVCLGFAGNTVGESFTGCQGTFEIAYDVMAETGALTKANAEYTVDGRLERGLIVQPLATKTANWSTDTLNTEIDYTLDSAQAPVLITSNSQASPTIVTTTTPHGLTTNDIILISGNTGSDAAINGSRVATVISTTTFSVPVDCSTSAGTGGTFVRCNTSAGAVGFLQVTAVTTFTNFVAVLRDSADNITYADLITFTDNVVAPFAERKTVAGVVDRYTVLTGTVTGSGSITCFAGLARL